MKRRHIPKISNNYRLILKKDPLLPYKQNSNLNLKLLRRPYTKLSKEKKFIKHKLTELAEQQKKAKKSKKKLLKKQIKEGHAKLKEVESKIEKKKDQLA